MLISHTRDTAGPIARSIGDLMLLDAVITGEAPSLAAVDLKGLRLGVARGYFFTDLDHNPSLSKFHMTPKFFGRLPSIPGIVAIKEVLTDLQHLESLFDAVEGRLKILQTFRAFFIGLLLGAAGGFINVFAVPACVRIAEVMKKGDIARAVEIQRRLNRWAQPGRPT